MGTLKTKKEILEALKRVVEISKETRERISREKEKTSPVIESEESITGDEFTSSA